MFVELLTEHHLELLSLKGGCKGLSESTLVKMSNCWKSHVAAQIHSVNKKKRDNQEELVSSGVLELHCFQNRM